MFLPCLFVLTLLVGPVPGAAQGPGTAGLLGPRLKISVFHYAGSDSGDAKTHFSRFKGILRDKVTVLVEEMAGGGPEFGYLGRLALEPSGDDGFPDNLSSDSAVRNYWDRSQSLILLRGIIMPENGKGYFAQSRMFLGDLQGRLARPSLSVKLPIADSQFGNTNDAHSLAIYYALATDAQREGARPAVVIALLSHAQDKIRDLRRRGPLSPETAELEKAVEQTIADLKGRRPVR
jgi:hypothetical protein